MKSQSIVEWAFDSVAGRDIIAPRRSSSAHLHRPWRAIKFKHLQKITVCEDEIKTVFKRFR